MKVQFHPAGASLYQKRERECVCERERERERQKKNKKIRIKIKINDDDQLIINCLLVILKQYFQSDCKNGEKMKIMRMMMTKSSLPF